MYSWSLISTHILILDIYTILYSDVIGKQEKARSRLYVDIDKTSLTVLKVISTDKVFYSFFSIKILIGLSTNCQIGFS